MQQMEIRSRQNREDATLSCSLGTASPYCFTNHLPALLHIQTNHVSYMLTNHITSHSNVLYIVCHHITLPTATLYSFSLNASLLLFFILPVTLHTASLHNNTRYMHCIILYIAFYTLPSCIILCATYNLCTYNFVVTLQINTVTLRYVTH